MDAEEFHKILVDLKWWNLDRMSRATGISVSRLRKLKQGKLVLSAFEAATVRDAAAEYRKSREEVLSGRADERERELQLLRDAASGSRFVN